MCLASKFEPYVYYIFVDVRLLKVSMTIEFNLKALEIDFKNLEHLSEYLNERKVPAYLLVGVLIYVSSKVGKTGENISKL